MNVFRHDNCGMKSKSRAVVMKAMTKNYIPSLGRQRLAVECAKSDEHHSVVFLIVRQSPPVIVFVPNELHGCVARTLLSAQSGSILNDEGEHVSNS